MLSITVRRIELWDFTWEIAFYVNNSLHFQLLYPINQPLTILSNYMTIHPSFAPSRMLLKVIASVLQKIRFCMSGEFSGDYPKKPGREKRGKLIRMKDQQKEERKRKEGRHGERKTGRKIAVIDILQLIMGNPSHCNPPQVWTNQRVVSQARVVCGVFSRFLKVHQTLLSSKNIIWKKQIIDILTGLLFLPECLPANLQPNPLSPRLSFLQLPLGTPNHTVPQDMDIQSLSDGCSIDLFFFFFWNCFQLANLQHR